MKYKIKDLMDVYRGASPRPIIEYLTDKGYRWLKISDFKMYDRYVYDTKEYIKETGVKKTRFMPKGTLILTNSATPGIPIFLGNDMCLHDGFLYFQNINERIINIKFLYYWFLFNKNKIVNQANGSVFQNLKKEIVENFEIDLPVIENQIKIVEVLEKINDKIELNNKINDNLQELINEYYKEVFKKENNFKKVKEVVEFSQGVQVPIENQYEELQYNLIRFIRIVDLTQGGTNNIRYIENKNRGVVNYDDIFMIRYGSPGILGWNYKGIIANNLFRINPKNDSVTKNYLYCYFNDEEIQNYIKQNATSSTMPAINFSLLYDRLIAIPEKERLMKFDRFVEDIRLKKLEIIQENDTLVKLRDSLLPKLMNGEIDLDKIEI